MQAHTHSPMELGKEFKYFPIEQGQVQGKGMWGELKAGTDLTYLPGVTSHLLGGGGVGGESLVKAKMTLTNPCVLYQPEGESAGGARTFHVQDMETGLGERAGSCPSPGPS